MEVYRGSIVYSKSREELEVFEKGYISVENGVVEGIYEVLPEKLKAVPVTDFGDGVIIPAFSDLHVHAPQQIVERFCYTGTKEQIAARFLGGNPI